MRLYNTLTLKVDEFKSLKKGHVGMYHCGPTVYDYAHIGNLRSYVFADTLRRGFEYLGFEVTQVINITDVGHLVSDQDSGHDKVEERARKEQKSATEIANFYSDAFFEDLRKLNINRTGTLFPRATDHIKEQIQLISILEKKGFAYKISDGIYFNTSKFKNYGKLGNINLQNLEEGARIGVNPEKKNSTDFALWKFSHTHEKRQQEWPSPWGTGFPGWHIECSAMSMKYLGETFDIHTGGIDHIPVHHNNEIAQSETVTGKPYARYWLHNAFVNVSGEKMAKSQDNFIRLKTLEEEKIHPLSYRYWLLTAHYTSPIIFSLEAVHAAQNALESIVRKISAGTESGFANDNLTTTQNELVQMIENDFDTPSCIALLHACANKIATQKMSTEIINDFDLILGLKLRDLVHYMMDIPENIKNLSKNREIFRQQNNWAKSDEIRKNLTNEGFHVEDSPNGPKIYRSLTSLL